MEPAAARLAAAQQAPLPALTHNTHQTKHTTKEIKAWTDRDDAAVSCFIKDIWDLEKNKRDLLDFYWLGAVPCKKAKIVGIVVGVTVYDKWIQYDLDDGTAVINCSKYHTRPGPVVRVGNCVQVMGAIRTFFEKKEIRVLKIGIVINEICASHNDELYHTLAVRELHKTVYSSKQDFVIPTRITRNLPKKIPGPSHSALLAGSSTSDMPSALLAGSSKSDGTGIQMPPDDKAAPLQQAAQRAYTPLAPNSPKKISDPSHSALLTGSSKSNTPPNDKTAPLQQAAQQAYAPLTPNPSKMIPGPSHSALLDGSSTSNGTGIHMPPNDKTAPLQQAAQQAYAPLAPNPSKMIPGPSHSALLDGSSTSNGTGIHMPPAPLQQAAQRAYAPEWVNDLVVNTIRMLVRYKEAAGKPYVGAARDEILDVLKDDSRWQDIGVCMVDEALKALDAGGMLWEMGEGKWDLTE